MSLPPFIDSVQEFPHLRIVKLQGELDTRAMTVAQDYLKKTKEDVILAKSVVLDLRKVNRVDTVAIAGLVQVLAGLKKKKFRLAIMNAPDALKDQLEIL